jgi:hypothetical protein
LYGKLNQRLTNNTPGPGSYMILAEKLPSTKLNPISKHSYKINENLGPYSPIHKNQGPK